MKSRDDELYSALVGDLLNAANRLAAHVEEQDGVRRSPDDLIALALEDVSRQRSEKTVAETGSEVPSLTARRLAKGLQAVVLPSEELIECVTLVDVPVVGGFPMLRALALNLFDDASESAPQRVLRTALERGLSSLRDEARGKST